MAAEDAIVERDERVARTSHEYESEEEHQLEAIDAFVYPTDAGIGGTPHTVEAAHHEFVSLYAPHAAKHGKPLAPLVRLDVSNWARPFELMKEAT